MRVEDIATRQVALCEPGTDLAAVGGLMWDAGCGIVPVVDPLRHLVGVVTDRDVAIALTTRGLRAHELCAADVMMGRVETCKPKDEVRLALDKMRRAHVRRLPVVDENGLLEGVLSLDDVALVAKPTPSAASTDVTYEDVARTLQVLDRRAELTAIEAKPEKADAPAASPAVPPKAAVATASGGMKSASSKRS